MREIDLHVAADEQIETAVVVVVREAAPRRPAAPGHARCRSDVREGAVAAISIQVIGTERGDVEVFESVAVDVSGTRTHRPSGMADSSLVGHVLELAVSEVV